MSILLPFISNHIKLTAFLFGLRNKYTADSFASWPWILPDKMTKSTIRDMETANELF
jgi:hypothetical protein